MKPYPFTALAGVLLIAFPALAQMTFDRPALTTDRPAFDRPAGESAARTNPFRNGAQRHADEQFREVAPACRGRSEGALVQLKHRDGSPIEARCVRSGDNLVARPEHVRRR